MKWVITGSRHASPNLLPYVCEMLDKLSFLYGIPTEIAHGGAKGYDSLAGAWAKTKGMKPKIYHADWSKGPSGGPIRNALMLDDFKPDYVMAFPVSDESNGTAGMIKLSIDKGYKVIRIPKPEDMGYSVPLT